MLDSRLHYADIYNLFVITPPRIHRRGFANYFIATMPDNVA